MATRERRFRDPTGLLEYGSPEDDQIQLTDFFRHRQGFGEEAFTPVRGPVRQPGFGGPDQSPWGNTFDFLSNSQNTSPADPNTFQIPVGPQPRPQGRYPGSVSGGVSGGGGGGGRGGVPQPSRPVDPSTFFGGPPEGGGLDVNEYLANQRGSTFQAAQTWNPYADQGFLAETARATTGLIGGLNNPIAARREYELRLRDPVWQREYQIRTYGYDPRFNRMIVPTGFDPATDAGFLQANQARAAARRAARESQLDALYGPDYAARRRAERFQQALDFFGAQ